MRIGILIPEFPTQTHIFFWREIVALRRMGVTVDLLSTRKPKDACPHEFGRDAAAETHYTFPPRLGASARSMLGGGTLRAARYVAELSPGERRRAVGLAVCAADLAEVARRRGIDHVHVHSCAQAAHVAAMGQLFHDFSFSLHLHGDLEVYGVDHAQKMKRAAFVAVAARPLIDQVVEKAGVPRERVFRMPMGVDVAHVEARPPRTAPGPLHLVSISRLALCKGHVFALEALRRVIDAGLDVRYSIAGNGSDRGAIEADVARLRLGDRVTLVGALSESGVRDLLKTADVFLLTSAGLGEASPVAVMEAMASGVPAICSRIGGTADMIASGVDGVLVDQRDVAGIADAVTRMAGDRDGLAGMSGAARRRAESDFDSMVLARTFVSTIEAARRGRPYQGRTGHAASAVM